MSMLAGPRRKQKVINLRAKNNAWSNDPNKFGQRMLEKMGWSSGKGLGAHENGMVEHVVARYKNDEKGLGFEDKNDQWTKHEDDFNALLANLSNGVGNEEKLHSGVSLEVKSKKSKARVHYHKFTRGKDLTRYSEKDLANIFGKKSLKNQSKEEVVEELQDDIKKTEQVFTEKGSMEDYFKNKLASLKTKVSYNSIVRDDEADYSFQGFAGTGDSEQNDPDVPSQDFSFYNESTTQTDEVLTKKKKKKKRNLVNTENHEIVNESNFIEAEVEEPVKKKKSKKKKKEPEDEAQNQEIIADIVEEECHVPKKKKKRKNKDNE